MSPDRREVIALLALSASAGLAARAQTGIKRMGVIYQGGPYEASIEGLRDGLRAAGLEEGRHVALLLRNARGDVAAAEAAARALERDEKVDVIVAIGTTTARAAKRATTEVPIVFAAGDRPGRGWVGRQHRDARRTADRLSLLDRRSHGEAARNPARDRAEASPHRHLLRPAHSERRLGLAAAREAAGKLGIEVVAQQVTSPEEIRDRLRTLTAAEAEAFFFVTDFLVTVHAPLVIEAANALRLPTMAQRTRCSSGQALLRATGLTFVNTGAARRVMSPAFSPAACPAISRSKRSTSRRWRST